MGTSIAFALVVGIPAGIISAVRQYGKLDYTLTGITMVTISTPTFVLGLSLVYIFGVSLRSCRRAGCHHRCAVLHTSTCSSTWSYPWPSLGSRTRLH